MSKAGREFQEWWLAIGITSVGDDICYTNKPDLKSEPVHVVEIAALEAEKQRSAELIKKLELIQGMCGTPDAATGCRNIMLVASCALKEYHRGGL